jgi:hypothetical protein
MPPDAARESESTPEPLQVASVHLPSKHEHRVKCRLLLHCVLFSAHCPTLYSVQFATRSVPVERKLVVVILADILLVILFYFILF